MWRHCHSCKSGWYAFPSSVLHYPCFFFPGRRQPSRQRNRLHKRDHRPSGCCVRGLGSRDQQHHQRMISLVFLLLSFFRLPPPREPQLIQFHHSFTQTPFISMSPPHRRSYSSLPTPLSNTPTMRCTASATSAFPHDQRNICTRILRVTLASSLPTSTRAKPSLMFLSWSLLVGWMVSRFPPCCHQEKRKGDTVVRVRLCCG